MGIVVQYLFYNKKNTGHQTKCMAGFRTISRRYFFKTLDKKPIKFSTKVCCKSASLHGCKGKLDNCMEEKCTEGYWIYNKYSFLRKSLAWIYLESERLLRGRCRICALFLPFCKRQVWSLLGTELDPPPAKCLINSELENIWGKGGSAKNK